MKQRIGVPALRGIPCGFGRTLADLASEAIRSTDIPAGARVVYNQFYPITGQMEFDVVGRVPFNVLEKVTNRVAAQVETAKAAACGLAERSQFHLIR